MSPETCRADLKRLKIEKSCCILLVAYIVVLVMHGHADIKFISAGVETITPQCSNSSLLTYIANVLRWDHKIFISYSELLLLVLDTFVMI